MLLLAAVGCNNEPLLDTGNRLEPDDFEDKDLVPDAIVDTHFQVGVPAVDVLWVVDNSRSMYEEQRALIAVFAAASLADVAAATRLSNPAAAKQQDAAVVKALQCAAAAPVPQLAQPALQHRRTPLRNAPRRA